MPTARVIAHDLVALLNKPVTTDDHLLVWLARGGGQDPPVAVAQLASRHYTLVQHGSHWALRTAKRPAVMPKTSPEVLRAAAKTFAGVRLTNVANQVGLDFKQGDFRFGTSFDVHSMMGGGLCWLDYNNDGWLDLFAVNSYSDADVESWNARGGLPRSALFENVHGHFVNVSCPLARERRRPGKRLRRRRLQRRRPHGSPHHHEHLQRAALEQRQRDVQQRDARRRHRRLRHLRLAHRRGRRRRQRGRTPRHLRLRLCRRERPLQELLGRFPLELPGLSGPALPERRPRRARALALPGGRAAGGHRACPRGSQPRRRVHRRERRRPARPLRGERPRPEPSVRQHAGWAARLPLRRGGARDRESQTRAQAWALPPRTTRATAVPTCS